jgi:alpha-methylacyl-CoA racemase
MWGPRGTNLLDGGAHFYGVYECRDGTYVSLAAFEPQFYAAFVGLVTGLGVAGLGEGDLKLDAQHDREQWPVLRGRLAALFRTRTRDEWLAFFAGHEICFAPVLTMEEARRHPHNVSRGTFATVDGVEQNAPAPRFSRTPGAISGAARPAGADTDAAFRDWGIAASDVAALRAAGAIA